MPDTHPKRMCRQPADPANKPEGSRTAEALLAESEARFRTLFENASDGILLFDGRQIVLDANPMMRQLLGRPLEDIRGREITAFLHPDDRNAAGRRLEALREGQIITLEQRLQSASGGCIRVEQNVRCIHADLHMALCRDLTPQAVYEHKLLDTFRNVEDAEDQLEEAIGRVSAMATEAEVAAMEMDQIFNATSDGICVIAKDFRITKCNRVLRETMEPFGFRLDRDRCHRVFGHPLCETERCLMRRILSGDGDRIEDEIDIVSAGRPTRTFIVSARPLMDLTGDTIGIVESYRDITERKQIEKELRRLAVTDPLTGAFNRRRFMQRAQEEMDRSRRYRTDLTLLMLDIDHFKSINDTYGHDAGDAVLKRMVGECAAQLRGSDVFCRLGGEEFAAILTHTSIEQGCLAAERLRQAIKRLDVPTALGSVRFTVSIGVASMAAGNAALEAAMKKADEALYAAKQQGRDCVMAAE